MTSESPSPILPSGIASAAERLRSLRVEARRVAVEIETHIAEHETQIKLHTAEVKAAKAMLMDLMPGVDKKTAEAAAFVLTSPTWTQGLVRFIGKNGRWLMFGISAIVFWKLLF